MTRGEVARYLGKSIATVRRIEGHHLHPHRGANGVFQFEAGEVRELRTALNRGELRLTGINFTRSQGPFTGNRPAARGADAIVTVRRELSQLRAVARDAIELFYLVCPEQFLAELEPEVLDAFDAILTDADQALAVDGTAHDPE